MELDICAMMREREELEGILNNAQLDTKEKAVEFAGVLTRLIWDQHMMGYVYEFYAADAVYNGAYAVQLTDLDDIVKEFLAMQAAFPDMKVFITESFASGNPEEGWKVYQRSYCEGTHLGASKYGMPTGKKLDKVNSFGQTVYMIKKVDQKWKVVAEYSLRSTATIEKLLKGEL